MTHTFKTVLTKDLPNKKIRVTREFAAPVERVWDAWTKPELLDQWWAPRPWRAETKKMDFRVGGHWMYAMVGPDGTRMWSCNEYRTIEQHKSFSGMDYFCNEDGSIDEGYPSMLWKNEFSATASGTRVDVEITFNNESDLLKIIEMGFEGGFTMAHGNLDELLAR